MNFLRIASTAPAASTAAATEAAAQPARGALLTNNMISILYGGLLLYFLYQIYKGYRSKAKLVGEKTTFTSTKKPLHYVLVAMMALLGVVNIWTRQFVSGILMLLLSAAFLYQSRDKIIVADNGIYGDSKFYGWDDFRKWGFDKNNGDLVMVIKERGKAESNAVIRVGQENMVRVNDLIREKKLKK